MNSVKRPQKIDILMNGHSVGCVCPSTSEIYPEVEIPLIEEVELIEMAFDGDIVLALDRNGQPLFDQTGNFCQMYPFYLSSKELDFSFYHPAIGLVFEWEAQKVIKQQLEEREEKLNLLEPDF